MVNIECSKFKVKREAYISAIQYFQIISNYPKIEEMINSEIQQVFFQHLSEIVIVIENFDDIIFVIDYFMDDTIEYDFIEEIINSIEDNDLNEKKDKLIDYLYSKIE